MRTKLFVSFFVFLSLANALTSRAQSVREKFNFNSDWKMQVGDRGGNELVNVDDSGWQKIGLPHAFNEDDAFRKSIEELGTGIVWYRKNFKIPDENKGRKIFIEFEGIRLAGEFYLNGKWIGRSENGIMAFGFDITNEIRYDSVNVLAAKIDNSWSYKEIATQSGFQWNDRNFYANYGGINKNVFLHITNRLYQTLPLFSSLGTTGVYIYPTDIHIQDHSATIHAESQIRNEENKSQIVALHVEITDNEGKPVAAFSGSPKTVVAGEVTIVSAQADLKNLHFWSWGYGYLYHVSTKLIVDGKVADMVRTTTGFRKTEFGNGMIRLNDRVFQVKGYAQRTTNEWPAIGLSVPAWLSDYSNHLMVAGNANLVRWMHVTPWKQDIESCDRVGLLEAMPAGDSEGDPSGRRWEQRTEVMKDAIIYNRNNPSIIFYECGNKGISEAHMLQMKQIRDEYDPFGGRAIGSREMLNSTIAEYGGEMLYINKSAGKPLWSMEYSRDEGMRKYWDEYSPPYHKEGDGPMYKGQPAPEYNHNQDAHAIENVSRWFDYWNERPGTGNRVNSGGVNIIFSESNTHHRGEANYRVSGEVDAMRIPKDGYYANRVMWNGWVDNESPDIHILGHWNYAQGVVKNIYVVSNTEKVELFLNNKSMGFGERSRHFLFTFKDISWKPGVIRAVGYDAGNKKVCEASHETAGQPAAIKLSLIASPAGFRADGADLALIQAEVVDKKGNRCPTALNMIHFDLDGAAEWRGGIAQGPDNYILSKNLPVECGVNRVFVRSLLLPGKIQLKASSDRLKEASLTFASTAFETKDGLSRLLPGDGLPARLDRGPTSPEPSFRVTRRPIKISSATAGSNPEKAALSYDDNETTDWFNDGSVTDAWIQYELEKESSVGEITLKLNGFRTRSYPIQILVDEKIAWEGTTPRTLGYCTLKFPPKTGSRIKIRLMDGISTQENKSVEVNGKSLDDGVKRNDTGTKARLSIIETEIYENLKP
jgi:beta-galactosidase